MTHSDTSQFTKLFEFSLFHLHHGTQIWIFYFFSHVAQLGFVHFRQFCAYEIPKPKLIYVPYLTKFNSILLWLKHIKMYSSFWEEILNLKMNWETVS